MAGGAVLQMAQAALEDQKILGEIGECRAIQMGVAIITYCLVAIMRNELKLKRSTYELLQILGISLTDKTPMQELFEKREIVAPEAQTTPFIPGLLD